MQARGSSPVVRVRAVASVASAVLLTLLLGTQARAGAFRPPSIVIHSPTHGSFSLDAQVTVTGEVQSISVATAIVKVNGVQVPVQPDRSFSAVVALDPAKIFNPILAELTATNSANLKNRARVTVVAGPSVADGLFSPQSVAMRINDSGLDAIEPTVEDLVDLDIASLMPVGTVVIRNFCAIDSIFGCLGRVDAVVTNPPPSITGFGIDVDSMTNAVAGDIAIQNLRVDLNLIGSGLAPSCGLRLTATTTSILGDYDLTGDPVIPTQVDVNQMGGVSVSFSNFNQQFTSGLCDFPLIGDLIQLIIGDIQNDVRQGLEDFLDDPDGAGPADGPIADAIEEALAAVEITGPIGEGLGVNLETPIFDIFEDVDGLTFDNDARVVSSIGSGPGQCQPPAGAPDLAASYHVVTSFPSFGATTPVGGLPYGLGLCISPSAFNQLLKAETECGLLRVDLTQFDFGGGPIPINAGTLALFVPEFGTLDPNVPLVIRLRPTLAPALTGNPGPGGELGEMRIGALKLDVVTDSPGATPWIEMQVDARVGLNFAFDEVAGGLSVTLGTVNPANITVAILENRINTNEVSLLTILPSLLAFVLPSLTDALGSFPLPDFLGLSLQGIEVSNQGQFMSVFLDLVPTP